MKKHLLFLVLTILICACKKEKSTSPSSGNNNNNPTSPYYFKFALDTANYNFTADIPQYMPFYANEAGGYEVASAALYPSMGLRLSWPANDTVKESDLLGLVGKTLYFSDTTIHPELSYDKDAVGNTWYSADTSNTSYNVKITNVKYLKNDTTLGYAVKTYVITGTCTAVMSPGTTTSILSGGSFNFIISRRDL